MGAKMISMREPFLYYLIRPYAAPLFIIVNRLPFGVDFFALETFADIIVGLDLTYGFIRVARRPGDWLGDLAEDPTLAGNHHCRAGVQDQN